MALPPGVRRLFALGRGFRSKGELVDLELRHHVEMRTAELIERGHSAIDARKIAEEAFGEIGLRIALGARSRDVERMVLGEGAWVIVGGIGAGLLTALPLARILRSFLYDLSGTDFFSYVATALMLLVAAVVATWLPARRATRMDPREALRSN